MCLTYTVMFTFNAEFLTTRFSSLTTIIPRYADHAMRRCRTLSNFYRFARAVHKKPQLSFENTNKRFQSFVCGNAGMRTHTHTHTHDDVPRIYTLSSGSLALKPTIASLCTNKGENKQSCMYVRAIVVILQRNSYRGIQFLFAMQLVTFPTTTRTLCDKGHRIAVRGHLISMYMYTIVLPAAVVVKPQSVLAMCPFPSHFKRSQHITVITSKKRLVCNQWVR